MMKPRHPRREGMVSRHAGRRNRSHIARKKPDNTGTVTAKLIVEGPSALQGHPDRVTLDVTAGASGSSLTVVVVNAVVVVAILVAWICYLAH